MRDENGRGARPVAADEGKAPPQLPHVVPRVEQEEEDHGTTRSRSRTLWAARADLKELIVSPVAFRIIFELHLLSPTNLSILEIAIFFQLNFTNIKKRIVK